MTGLAVTGLATIPLVRSQDPTRAQAIDALRRLHELVDGGVSIGDALALAAKTEGGAAKILARLTQLTQRGKPLSWAMHRLGGLYRAEELAVVRAGERAGNFPQALGLLLARLEQRRQSKDKLKATLAYPLLLLGVALVAFIFLGSQVLPSVASFSKAAGAPTPWLTQTYIDWSRLVRDWIPGVVFLTATGGWTVRWLRTRNPSFDQNIDAAILSLPWIGNVIFASTKSDAFSLAATVLEAGSTLEEALDLTRETITSPAIAAKVHLASTFVRSGTPLSQAWKRAGLDRRGDECGMLQLAETAGSYAQACKRLAVVRGAERDRALTTFRVVAEPAALGLVAMSVAGALTALYEPLFASGAALTGGIQ